MNILETVGSDPRAWIVLALFAARAAWSAAALARAPARVAAGAVDAMATSDPRALRFGRFFFTMVAGIALAIVGLFRLAAGAEAPALALFMLVLGVYLFTTEPVRRQITLAGMEAVRNAGGPEEANALDDLRTGYVRLVLLEFAIVGVLLFGMLAL